MINRSGSIFLALFFMFLSACGGGGSSTNTGSNTSTGTVAPQSSGAINLTWTAPASRSDGSALALSEISGYTIYFGSSVGDYPYSVAIEDPSTTQIDITDLPVGTYYLVMTTTDSNGQESGYSNVAVKEVAS
ncbi:hypothetical protein DFR30_1473 [Thiogranum longum]|uniref:Fibronectin type-III domain-containing protein n=1 Tax=Thiogranum longum TaxID=1537524 RepID=A0A4R1HA57_9GAMM|nr:fibronectin type III domain-containing protein [Thiogranum longum]TCK18198.1 hypothetical protein DFR30_1473 [Thiogranum longum]